MVLAASALGAARWARPADVVAVSVVRGHAVDAIYATGTVEAEQRVVVKAKVAGSIAELLVREGDAVHRGELLARVDDPAAAFELRRGQVEASAASAQAGRDAPHLAATRARIEATRAQLASAKRELDRARSLVASGSVATSEQDRANDRVQELQANLDGLRADLDAQRIELESNASRARATVGELATHVSDAEVRAPQDGIVLARYVEPGEVVAVNHALFKVGDTKSLLLEVSIDEADVARVHDGSDGVPASRVAASLHAFPGRSFAGRVVQIMPDADRDKKSYLAKVRLDDPPPGLRSGMSVEVNIVVAEHDGALLAPADAIKDGQVWRIAGGHAERRRVKVGIHDLLRSEILEGLTEGDVVAVGGVEHLSHDGTRVRVTMRKADAPATQPEAVR